MSVPFIPRALVSASVVLAFLFAIASNRQSMAQTASNVSDAQPLPQLAIEQVEQHWHSGQTVDSTGWRQKWHSDRVAQLRSAAAAKTIWVDASAQPGGDGSQTAPVQTINAAVALANNDTTITDIAVQPGNYNETPIQVPANVALYAAVGYTNTFISGDIALTNGSVIADFSIDVLNSVQATGENIIVYSNDFFDSSVAPTPQTISLSLLGESYIQFNAFRVASLGITGNPGVYFNFINAQTAIDYPAGTTGESWFEGNLVVKKVAIAIHNDESSDALVIANNWVVDSDIEITPSNAINNRPIRILNNDLLGESPLRLVGGYLPGLVSIWNNILAYQTNALVLSSSSNLDIRNNLFWNNQTDASDPLNPVGTNGNFRSDPQFVNPNTGNFHINIQSPALDKGIDSALRVDFDFEARPCDGNLDGTYIFDIGGDEYATDRPCLSPPTPTPTETATETPTETSTATATETATPGPIYLPLISKAEPPTPTPTATATNTPTASATPTQTPTATNTPVPTSLPLNFFGGPLYRALVDNNAWYLRADGRISYGANGAEPFPLDPQLEINSIAAKSEPLNASRLTLYALAKDGMYKRMPDSYRWEKLNDLQGKFLGAGLAYLFFTPLDHPDQVWMSRDGENWESASQGLEGKVVSPVTPNYSYGPGFYVVTERNGHNVLWKTPEEGTTFEWVIVGEIPGPSFDAQKGIFAHPADSSSGISKAILVGSGDGKLYDYRYFDAGLNGPGWVPIWDFGAGNYPIPLFNRINVNDSEVAVINQTTGEIKLYEGSMTVDKTGVVWSWHEKVFPYQGLTFGVATLANGEAIAREYDSINSSWSFAKMYLAQSGSLYSYELDLSNIDPGSGQATYSLKKITTQPERVNFSMTYSQGADFIGKLYSGAELTWNGATCSASENGFYESSDRGASWTKLAEDHGRHLLLATYGNPPPAMLAMSCTGPELSNNGGISWTTTSALNWPLTIGAPYFAIQYGLPSTLYVAGVDKTGASYVFSTTFDAATGQLGTWNSIAPAGLITPTAISFVSASFGGEDALYLADTKTVWMSKDGGATWKSRSQGLNGAKIVGFTGFSNSVSRGVIAASDQGLLFAPLIDQDGPWLTTQYSYTTQPIGFDNPIMLRGQSAQGEAVFNLLPEAFVWSEALANPTPTPTATQPPTATPTVPTATATATSTATVTPTPTQTSTPLPTATHTATPTNTATATATATPTPSPTPSPIPNLCPQLVINPGFENSGGWTLPATAYSAVYSSEQVAAGLTSLRVGIPISGVNTLSYSSVYQTINLPTNASQITLQARIWRGSSSSTSDTDSQYLWLSPSGMANKVVFSGRSNSQSWETITYDLTSLKGKSVQLLFGTYNNGSGGKTVMYVDNVSVLSCQ